MSMLDCLILRWKELVSVGDRRGKVIISRLNCLILSLWGFVGRAAYPFHDTIRLGSKSSVLRVGSSQIIDRQSSTGSAPHGRMIISHGLALCSGTWPSGTTSSSSTELGVITDVTASASITKHVMVVL